MPDDVPEAVEDALQCSRCGKAPMPPTTSGTADVMSAVICRVPALALSARMDMPPSAPQVAGQRLNSVKMTRGHCVSIIITSFQ